MPRLKPILNTDIDRDVTVTAERGGVFLDVTFAVVYDYERWHEHGHEHLIVTISKRRPIYVMYSDVHDRELEWRYGENMPSRIVNALEALESPLAEAVMDRIRSTILHS